MPFDALIIDLPVVIKARAEDGKRLLDINCSSESIDDQGDLVTQKALLDSADSFVASGFCDIDHLGEIGYDIGIPNPLDWIVGRPLSVSDMGKGRTGVRAEIYSGQPKADELWSSLMKGEEWKSSIFGYPLPGLLEDCRINKSETGACRFIVHGIRWCSLAMTQSPVNNSLTAARVVTAKSYAALMKARLANPGAIPKLPAPTSRPELISHFGQHIRKGACAHAGRDIGVSVWSLKEHFTNCCGPRRGDLDALGHVEAFVPHPDDPSCRLIVEVYRRPKPPLRQEIKFHCVFRGKSARHSDLISAGDSEVMSAIPI